MTIRYVDFINGLDYYSLTAWALSQSYVIGNLRKHGTAPNAARYNCILGHTSSADNEPGVGPSWTTYWTKEADGSNTLPFKTWDDAMRGLVGADEVRDAKSPAHTALSYTLSWTDNSATITATGDLTGELANGDCIGKNTAGEAWYEVNTVIYSNPTTTITLYGKYYGTTESATGYKAGITSAGSLGSTTALYTANVSGTYGSPIKITGGWTLATQTQDGETYYKQTGTRGYGYLFYASNFGNYQFEKISGLRFNYLWYIASTPANTEYIVKYSNGVSANYFLSLNGSSNTSTRCTLENCNCGSMQSGYAIYLYYVYGKGTDGSTIKDCNFYGSALSYGIYSFAYNITYENTRWKNFSTNFYIIYSRAVRIKGYLDCRVAASVPFYLSTAPDTLCECDIRADGQYVYIDSSPGFICTGKIYCLYVYFNLSPKCALEEVELQGASSYGVRYVSTSRTHIGKLTAKTSVASLFTIENCSSVDNRIGTLVLDASPTSLMTLTYSYGQMPVPMLMIGNNSGVMQIWYYYDTSGSDHGRVISNTAQAESGRCLELQPSRETYLIHHILEDFAVAKVKSGVAKSLTIKAKHDGNDRVELEGCAYVDGIQVVAWTTFALSSSYQTFTLSIPGGSIPRDTLATMWLRFRSKDPNNAGSAYVDSFDAA